jgi:hypothetical protein
VEAPDIPQDPGDTGVDVGADVGEDAGIDVAPPEPEPAGPGWVTIHRLNRTEYNNTFRDLLKDESEPANSFPDDDQGYGYDNIANVLAVSPLLFEKLERASENLIEDALTVPIDASFVEHIEAEYTEPTVGGASGNFWNLWSNGSLGKSFTVEKTGTYLVSVRAAARQGGPDIALMSVDIDGVGANFDVAAEKAEPALYQIAVSLSGSEEPGSDGSHSVAVSFLNDFFVPDEGIDRNLYVDWIHIEGPFDDSTVVEHIEAESLVTETFGIYQIAFLVLDQPGEVEAQVAVPKDGAYDLSLRLFGLSPDDQNPRMIFKIDGETVGDFDVEPTQPELATTWVERLELTEGQKTLSVSIDNPNADGFPANPRTIYLDFIRVVGPMEFSTGPPPEVREEILICEPEAGAELECVKSIIDAFGRRAWRRPLESDEVDRLGDLYTLAIGAGADHETSVRTVLKAVLLSPNFLYRVELDPDPSDPTPHLLGQYELASRLSYALWSSMPDQELFDRAEEGALNTPEVLVSEVKRMLTDERSGAIVDNFAGQWLHLRNLDDVVRDSTEFPDFDEDLAQSMRLETELLFEHFLSGQFDFREFWAPGYSFIDQRLANLYGLEGEFGSDLALTNTEGTERVGLLTHGSILTVTSHTFRTSPVNRGRWIMGQLLCAEPPPPPGDLDTTLDTEGSEDLTVKEQMAVHREKPECIGCHVLMDPLGLSLEHFDAIGKWREEDNGKPIEAFDELPDGTPIVGADGVTQYVQGNANTMPCVAEQLFTYMLGRGMTYDDNEFLDLMMLSWEEADYTLESLLTIIALSDTFRMRQAPQDEEEVE